MTSVLVAELAHATMKGPQDEEAQPPPTLPPTLPPTPAANVADMLPPPPPQPHTETLPEGWSAEKDPESGDTFYVNLVTDETTWVKPTRSSNALKAQAKSASIRAYAESIEEKIETRLTHKHSYGWKRSLEEVVGELAHMDTDEELAEVKTMRHSLHTFLEGTWYVQSAASWHCLSGAVLSLLSS